MAKIRKLFINRNIFLRTDKHLYAFLVLLFSATGVYSQVVLKGHIFDEKTKDAIIGGTVLEKSTGNGATSDFNGEFMIRPHSPLPVTLVVSYIGYKTREIEVTAPDLPLNIALAEDINTLNEVVVVGYGTQRRKELTGSVSSVPNSVLENNLSPTLDNLLGGAIAGLNVTQSSGQPGAGSSIRIRGGNSLNASNEPLYVVDGFIFFNERNATQTGVANIESSLNPLASINPADIESIEVLKDVSAKSIYGSRGANGVIIVTTKKRKPQQ